MHHDLCASNSDTKEIRAEMHRSEAACTCYQHAAQQLTCCQLLTPGLVFVEVQTPATNRKCCRTPHSNNAGRRGAVNPPSGQHDDLS